MSDFDEVLIFILAAILVIGAIFGLVCISESVSCSQKYSSFENKWGVFSNCQIKLNDKWIPADAYYIKQDLQK